MRHFVAGKDWVKSATPSAGVESHVSIRKRTLSAFEEFHNFFAENLFPVLFLPQVLRCFVFLHYFTAHYQDLFLLGGGSRSDEGQEENRSLHVRLQKLSLSRTGPRLSGLNGLGVVKGDDLYPVQM